MEKLFNLYSKIMTITEGNILRLDYLSYVVAVICFLFAGIVFAVTPAYISDAIIVNTLTVVLTVLGLILIGIGYSQRPKETISRPSTLAPAPAEHAPILNTTASSEEPQNPQEKTKQKKKAVRKHRKKA
jgi:hypothetical protein